jgi:hypothetical protein
VSFVRKDVVSSPRRCICMYQHHDVVYVCINTTTVYVYVSTPRRCICMYIDVCNTSIIYVCIETLYQHHDVVYVCIQTYVIRLLYTYV